MRDRFGPLMGWLSLAGVIAAGLSGGCVELFDEPTRRPSAAADGGDGDRASHDSAPVDGARGDRGADADPTDVQPGEPDAGPAVNELCNGIDDDGDGAVDEGHRVGEPCSVGVGACREASTIVCVDGRGECRALGGTPSPEGGAAGRCNGVDDDCDGLVDEEMLDRGAGAVCRVASEGCVRRGRTVCEADGQGLVCALDEVPGPESCNGMDDDCDGEVDEDCRAVDIHTHGSHVCAVQEGGALDCWGSGLSGAMTVPAAVAERVITRVAVGDAHTCVLDADGGFECWGAVEVPRRAGTYRELCAGQGFGCALTGAGLIECSPGAPVPDDEAGVYQVLSCYHRVVCAQDFEFRPRCWPLEDGILPAEPALRMAVGRAWSCVERLADGALDCGGDFQQPAVSNRFTLPENIGWLTLAGLDQGRVLEWFLEDGAALPAYYTPSAGLRFEQIIAGIGGKSCGITTTGAVACWSWSDGQHHIPPVDAPPFASLGTARSIDCGVTVDGDVRCWGTSAHDALAVPVDLRPVSVVAPTTDGVCVLTADEGAVRCWGRDHPVNRDRPGPYAELACAGGFCCARRRPDPPEEGADAGAPSGEVTCWGSATEGPNLPDDLHRLTAGYGWVCGLDATGRPACTGRPDVFGAWNAGPWDDLAIGLDVACAGGPDERTPGRRRVQCRGPGAGDLAELDTWSVRSLCVTTTGVVCGIATDSGLATCRMPQPSRGPWIAPPPVPMRSLSCDQLQVCGLDESGRTHCWGML